MDIKIDKDGIWVSQAVKGGYIFCEMGGVFDMSYPSSKLRRGRVQGGGQICPAIPATMILYRVEKRNNGTVTNGLGYVGDTATRRSKTENK